MNETEALIVKTARRTLEIEAQTLLGLVDALDEDFVAAVEAIFHTKGRVIVTGVGKSALIAQKVVATLNSTGTPAIFMHAADAIHGDLGMIREEDIVIALSKSGESPEIRVLAPLLKQLGNLLIGMTSNRTSYLSRQAGYVLHTPVDQEADPNNLAPTASTTAQAAMGDALATALLALRGFSREDFALFHPGGTLGKQLYLRIHDLYPQHEKPCVQPTDSLRRIIIEITSKRLGAAVVIDEDDRILGIITDGDLRRMLEKGTDLETATANDIMTAGPRTVHRDDLAVKALEIMRRNSITQLIVTDSDNHYLGMVHLHDLLKEGLI